LLGFLNPFLYYIILFKAYSILPAQEALSLNYLWAITLTLLSIPILKQKISFMSIFAIFISFIGVIIIAIHGNILTLKFTNPIGVSLALSSTIVWSLFWIYNVKDERDDVAKLFLNFLFGFIFILITLLFTRKLSIPSFNGLLGASYVGIFEMGITFILWLKALSLSKTTAKVSNLIYLSPFISLVIIRFAVGEEIFASTVIGLLLIVTGIFIQRRVA
jgi:drug/metabolite transporter (DMT)-like permease